MSNAEPIARIVAIARGEVGYRERANNWTKYPPQVPGLEWAQNQPWCATGLSWCAMEAGLSDYYPRTASVPVIYNYAHKTGQWSEYPAVGAWVVIGRQEHCGIVVDWDANTITTVEFNSNDNGSSNGDGVYLRKRNRRDRRTTGYFYPKIPNVFLRSADPNYKPPAKTYTTVKGDKLNTAKGVAYALAPGQTVKVL